MEPHLWSYRQRISLEHLGQTLLEKKLKDKYPILHNFLQVVSGVCNATHLDNTVLVALFVFMKYSLRYVRFSVAAWRYVYILVKF